jgi:hypothetical protein
LTSIWAIRQATTETSGDLNPPLLFGILPVALAAEHASPKTCDAASAAAAKTQIGIDMNLLA